MFSRAGGTGGCPFELSAYARASSSWNCSSNSSCRSQRLRAGAAGRRPGRDVPARPPGHAGRLADGVREAGRGAAASCCGGLSANQVSQQKLKAQLTRAWWRRIAVSERTWKWVRDTFIGVPRLGRL
jgi:hypothetical protein